MNEPFGKVTVQLPAELVATVQDSGGHVLEGAVVTWDPKEFVLPLLGM